MEHGCTGRHTNGQANRQADDGTDKSSMDKKITTIYSWPIVLSFIIIGHQLDFKFA